MLPEPVLMVIVPELLRTVLVLTLPLVRFPVALTSPPVNIFPPVTLALTETTVPSKELPVTVPVAEINPPVNKLPPETLAADVIVEVAEINPLVSTLPPDTLALVTMFDVSVPEAK